MKSRGCAFFLQAANFKLLKNLEARQYCCYPTPFEGREITVDHGDPGFKQLPIPGSEIAERNGVAKEQVAPKICNRTVPNKMRGILDWMTTDAARRTLNSSNFSEIRVEQKAVFVVAKTRENATSATRNHKFLRQY